MEKIKLNIEQKYFPAIGHFFTPIVLTNIENDFYSPYLSEVCHNSGILKSIDKSISLGMFLDIIFQFLLKHYRNEYVYKNIIANKILLGKHSLNTTQMLSEFRIGNNKADVVILNGASTVYEIKTEYDSFARLNKQLHSYCMAFEYVNVITTTPQIERIKHRLPSNVGLISFTKRNTLSVIRGPKSNIKNINLEFLFDSLRKEEYLKIIAEYYNAVPSVPNTKIYHTSKKLFCNIPKIDALKLTYNVLKKRNNSKFLKEYIDKIPYSIVAYVLNINKKPNRLKKIVEVLNKELSELI